MSGARVPLAAWLAALAAAAAIAAGARYTADLSAFLPRSPSPVQQLLVDQLREGAVGRVMLIAIEGGDASARAAASRALAERLRGDARFAYVANGAAGSAERERQLLIEHRYLLSPAVTPERFSEQGLRAAIEENLDTVASSAGGLAQALLARDPTGEVARMAEARLASAAPPAVREGVWASRDGERAVLLARTAASGADTDGQEAAVRATQAAFAAGSAPGLRIRVTGAGVFAVESRARIKGEVARLAVLGAALVAALLLVAFRSLAALALGLLPVLTGALAGVAAVALGFGVVHGITLGFGITLIGEAVDYAIYLFVQTAATEDARERRAAWLADFWPTIRLGVLTSLAGFGALLLSNIPGLAQLGLYSFCGLAGAALFTRFVLPTLLPAGFHVRDLSAFGARLSRLCASAPRWRHVVTLLAIAAAAVLLAKRDTLWAENISSLSTLSEESQAYDGRLRSDLGAADSGFIAVVEGGDEQEALRGAERVGAALQPLVAQGAIAGFDSPASYLPSEATQRARAESLPPPRELRARLERALRGLPLRAARLDAFVADAARVREGARLRRADLAGTGLGVALDALLLRRGDRWLAILSLNAPRSDSADIDADRVRAALRGSGAVFLDLKAEADALYAGYLREAIALSTAGVAVVLLLLMIALRSAVRVGRVAAPLGAAVLVTAALLAAAGQALTLLHLVGFLLVVAVASNYALFFEFAAAQGPPAPRVLASLALANATTVIGFGVLASSDVPVLHALGVTVAVGTMLALAFAALLAGARGAGARGDGR